MNRKLHIVSFDVPFPPNYGGVIDVFYKLKALNSLGIEIYLHTFEYGRGKQKELNKYCKKVIYYQRNSFIKSLLSTDPFIVKTRANEDLIMNLNKDNYPILFEGLHTTNPLINGQLNSRKTFVRAHNIEHKFYKGLAKSESSIFKRNFFKQEAKKLKRYEKNLTLSDGIFTISPLEQEYFYKKYGDKCEYIPAFFDASKQNNHSTKGKFILYHGNLKVSENVKAALFLIDVYKDSSYPIVIASNFKNNEIIEKILTHKNITFHDLEKDNDLINLFEKAHINVLPTFQNTGIKLKLLNTLCQGKFVIANDFMVENTGLESLCYRANTKSEFLNKTEQLFQQDFNPTIIEARQKVLENFSPINSAKKLIEVIFNS